MTINQLKRFLPYALQVKASVMLHGFHGIGKSESVRQFAQENGYEFIDRRLSQMESGDLMGLPSLNKATKISEGSTSFLPPDWLPRDPNSKGILFLDEINRARRDVLQAVFQLVLDRQIGDYRLPDGWHVISAVNPNTDNYDVTNTFDEALKDRFLHIKLEPSNEEYFAFLRKDKELNQDMISFLQTRPELIEDSKLAAFTLDRKPSKRSWKKAMQLSMTGIPADLQLEGIGGLVGATNVSMFQAWLEENGSKPFLAQEILSDLPKHVKKIEQYASPHSGRHDLLQATLDNVKGYLIDKKGQNVSDNETDNLIAFLKYLPKDLSWAFFLSGMNAEDNDVKLYFIHKLFGSKETDDMILSNEIDPNTGKNDYEMLADLETLVSDLKKANKKESK